MSEPGVPHPRREVSPLELFYDLVFVLAVGQLTQHLVDHLTWRGGAETLVALVAACTVWSFTSFQVTLLDIEQRATQVLTIVAMCLGLFMNAGIANAFADRPWLFVAPMLVALLGLCGYARTSAPSSALRSHFGHALVWFGVSAPFWVVGAALDADARIWCWAIAAAVDLIGVWAGHPVRGGAVRTARLDFDARHMLERMRLFLIILLGEAVLSLGRALSEQYTGPLVLLLALGGFLALVALYAVYFGRAEQVVVRHTAAVDDPIRSVHVGLDVIYGVLAGLVMLAVGTETVLAHPHSTGVAGTLVLAGPALYLLSQAVWFRVETGSGWGPRAVGTVVLGVGAAAAYWLPAYAVVVILVVVLGVLAGYLSRLAPDSSIRVDRQV